MLNNKRTVQPNADINEIKNLKSDTRFLAKSIGINNNEYPIKIPVIAVGTQNTVPEYTAQVKSNKQIEIRLVTVNTSNLFVLKKKVYVGTKAYAQAREVSTTKNHESV